MEFFMTTHKGIARTFHSKVRSIFACSICAGSILISASLSGCSSNTQEANTFKTPPPVKATVMQVQAQTDMSRKEYSASIESEQQAHIATKIMGNILAITVKEGDKVRKGQALIRLDDNELQSKLSQSEAKIAEAQAHFTNAQTILERFKTLQKESAATQKELDEMKQELLNMLDYTELRAPFSGIITQKHAQTGDLAKPGFPLLTIQNVDRMEVVASIPESDINTLKVGDSIAVMLAGSSMKGTLQQFRTVLKTVIPAANSMNHQFTVKAAVPATALPYCKPGMYARLSINTFVSNDSLQDTVNHYKSTITIPRSALIHRGQLTGVFILDNDQKAFLRWVQTGKKVGSMVEILSGLHGTETIITSNLDNIQDGQKVISQRTTSEVQ
jgi:RND family efflux transporter MFP subunit